MTSHCLYCCFVLWHVFLDITILEQGGDCAPVKQLGQSKTDKASHPIPSGLDAHNPCKQNLEGDPAQGAPPPSSKRIKATYHGSLSRKLSPAILFFLPST